MAEKQSDETPEAKADAIEAMRRLAEGQHPLTPEESAYVAQLARQLVSKFEPRPIETPVYKPPM